MLLWEKTRDIPMGEKSVSVSALLPPRLYTGYDNGLKEGRGDSTQMER